MKILHCCLANFYVDNYGYQENILPKQHKKDGHEVAIVASTETYPDHKTVGYVEPGSYISNDGIPVTRLPYSTILPRLFMKKLRMYQGFPAVLERFEPDVVFVHDLQFIDMRHLASYARRHPNVLIFVDCHADFFNSARNWISKYVMHKVIYRICARMIEPHTNRFYGVLPLRCDFLHDVYKIPRAKIELLELGGEDDKIHPERRDEIRSRMCAELGLRSDDFIIVTGGKLDGEKNTKALIDAVLMLASDRVKLVIFGSMTTEVRDAIGADLDNPAIRYIGWINADAVYDYFAMADLGVFPGLHSVLWEQAVACRLPSLFRSIDGIRHVDTGGNCLFLDDCSPAGLASAIRKVTDNPETYRAMKSSAAQGAQRFMYSDIARRSIVRRPA